SCSPCRLPAHGAWEERHGCAAAASPQRASRLHVCHILCLGNVLHTRTCLHEASAFASVPHSRLIPQPELTSRGWGGAAEGNLPGGHGRKTGDAGGGSREMWLYFSYTQAGTGGYSARLDVGLDMFHR